MKKLLRINILLAVILNILVTASVPLVLPLYSITAETARLVLIIVAIHDFFSATVQPFALPLSSGLRAAGDVAFTMYSALFCTLVIRVLFSFVLSVWMGMGIVGIAWAMILDWIVRATLIVLRWRSGKWHNHSLIN